jgi:asparagine synthase (glutamine-hydrolysing)
MFSGYYDHHNAYLAAMKIENNTQYKKSLDAWRDVVLPIVRNPFLQDPDYFIKYPDSRDHIYLDADVFSSCLHDEYSELFTEESYTSSSLLRNRMANELFHESVPVILHEDDLNAMYYSVENRSPFLDSDLFSWCQKIPTRHLVKNGRAKSILRDAAIGLAPEKIMNNPRKIGFNVPLESYLDIGLKNIKDSLLEDSPIFDVVKREKIEDMLNMQELPNSRSKFLFNFVCSKIFLEEYAA